MTTKPNRMQNKLSGCDLLPVRSTARFSSNLQIEHGLERKLHIQTPYGHIDTIAAGR